MLNAPADSLGCNERYDKKRRRPRPVRAVAGLVADNDGNGFPLMKGNRGAGVEPHGQARGTFQYARGAES